MLAIACSGDDGGASGADTPPTPGNPDPSAPIDSLDDGRFVADFLWSPIDLTQAVDLGAVAEREPSATAAGDIAFEEVTIAAGLGSVLSGGNSHGVGIAFVDLNADNWDDLVVINGSGGGNPPSVLYLNNQGSFADATESSGLDSILAGRDCYSIAAADYDEDGDIDLYVTCRPTDFLLRNAGDGTFTDATSEAQAGGPLTQQPGSASKIASFGDFDRDGRLDLVSAYTSAQTATGYLLRNLGDGSFEDITLQSSMTPNPSGNPCAVLWSDFNNDSYQDLWVWNDRGLRSLLKNEAGQSFTDLTDSAGLSVVYPTPEAGNPMGIDSADINHDGFLDIYVSDIGSRRGNPLLLNNGDETFSNITFEAGTSGDFGWGLGFEDFNADTWPDILVAQEDNRPLQIYNNLGQTPPRFSLSELAHPPVTEGTAHNVALAFADYDHDGRTDAVAGTTDGSRINLFRNVTSLGGNHWLEVSVPRVPVTGARGGISARVVVKTPDLVQFLDIKGGSSRASQNALSARFGLGPWSAAELVAVLWPTGEQLSAVNVPADQRFEMPAP